MQSTAVATSEAQTMPGGEASRHGRSTTSHQRQHEQRRRDKLAGGRGQCGDAAEPPPVNAGEGVGDRGEQAGRLGQQIGSEPAQQVRPHQHHDARKAKGDAEDARRRQLLIVGEHVRDQHGEQRCRRVQDGCEAARDRGLAVGDQRERDRIVERRHDREPPPCGARQRQRLAAQSEHKDKHQRGNADAAEHRGERRQVLDEHLPEEKVAPQSTESVRSSTQAMPLMAGVRVGIGARSRSEIGRSNHGPGDVGHPSVAASNTRARKD